MRRLRRCAVARGAVTGQSGARRAAGRAAAPDADLDLVPEALHAPLQQRRLHRSGPLTDDYADALVGLTLRAFAP